MIFRSAIIKTNTMIFSEPIDNSSVIKFVEDVKLIRDFVIFRTKRFKSTSPYGVEMNDQEYPLAEVTNGGKIIDIKFFIFHLRTKAVYYDGNKDEVIRLLKVYFKIDRPEINPEIDFDDLYSLSSMKIVDSSEGNLSLFSNDVTEPEAELSELADVCRVREQTREIKFLTFQGIKVQNLKSFVQKNNTGLKRIYLNGTDSNGNQLTSDSEGQLSRKFTVFEKSFTWQEKKDMDLTEILDELLRNLRN